MKIAVIPARGSSKRIPSRVIGLLLPLFALATCAYSWIWYHAVFDLISL